MAEYTTVRLKKSAWAILHRIAEVEDRAMARVLDRLLRQEIDRLTLTTGEHDERDSTDAG